jgi:hypothetical protein
LSPKGEFSNRLERALDLSKNVLDQAKRDLGNSLSTFDISIRKRLGFREKQKGQVSTFNMVVKC